MDVVKKLLINVINMRMIGRKSIMVHVLIVVQKLILLTRSEKYMAMEVVNCEKGVSKLIVNKGLGMDTEVFDLNQLSTALEGSKWATILCPFYNGTITMLQCENGRPVCPEGNEYCTNYVETKNNAGSKELTRHFVSI